ncbi:MAG TPA: L,D-transpeptidase family protein [Candidatus Saccharimonadales bacterium]|nr:L,D-transpeptidase family protein [Candidatus Saccharimonadales bacterium]
MPKQTKKKTAAKKQRAKQKKVQKPAVALVVQAVADSKPEPKQQPAPAEPIIAAPAARPKAARALLGLAAAEPSPFPTKHPKWYRGLIYGSLSMAVIAALWLSGAVFWSKITVGSATVSGATGSTQLESLISAQAAAYHVTLSYPDGKSFNYPLRAVGLIPDTTASVKAVRTEQRSPKHLLMWWKPVNATVKMRVNNTALSKFIATQATVVTKAPQNATLTLKDGKAEVTGGANGKLFGFSNPTRSILQAAEGLQTAPLRLTTITRAPAVNERTLAPVKTKVEHILNQRVTLDIGGQNVSPSAKDIANWVTLTPTATSVDIAVNQDKLKQYVSEQAVGHTKPPRSQVVSDAGGAVLTKGANGVTVTNTDDAVKTLAGSLLDATGTTAKLPVTTTAYKTVRAPTGGKWIEVDLATKRMYAYDQGDVVHSFLVSAGAAGTPTVTGRFAIYSKYTSQDMFGANADGSRYFQPRVPYINYFYRDYAIHGNYWRPASYFGNINSSHGCVGISVSEGAWMYSWAPIGTPVVVHY